MVNKRAAFIIAILVSSYVFSRLYNLTGLPVFADEAIYIRWSQLMVNQPGEHTFLPMFDGKTPLHMWALTQFLKLNPLDPLWASRFMSIIFGLLNLGTLVLIVRTLKGKWLSQLTTAILYIILPFTLFHDRMGLIDTMLTAFIALSFLFLVKFKLSSKPQFAILSGIFWGLALLTKIPALFFAPIFIITWLFLPSQSQPTIKIRLTNLINSVMPQKLMSFWSKAPARLWRDRISIDTKIRKHIKENQNLIRQGLWLGIAGAIGLGLLFSLKVSELFPFLFTRSQDFSADYTGSINQIASTSMNNLIRVTRWLGWYLSFPVLILPFAGWFLSLTQNRARNQPSLFLGLCALIFALPLLILGQVLASRYFLPVTVWLIPAAALSIETLWQNNYRRATYIVGGLILIQSVYFSVPLLTNPDSTPFTREDTVQYLGEWSSGHGVFQVKEFIRQRAQETQVVVATEGYFGTLPDGLIMYFDRDPVIQNLRIEGIGQPIRDIPQGLIEESKDKEVYILVNSHRLLMEPIPKYLTLTNEYPRPNNAPTLQLYKIAE